MLSFTVYFTWEFRRFPRVVSDAMLKHSIANIVCYWWLLTTRLSSIALCLLANFDDEFGVVGLGDAFPMTRAALGGIFVVLFVVCRVLLWTSISYYCFRDFMSVLKGSDPRKKGFDLWYRFTFFSLSILSLLQIIWLFEIGRIALEELEKIGLL